MALKGQGMIVVFEGGPGERRPLPVFLDFFCHCGNFVFFLLLSSVRYGTIGMDTYISLCRGNSVFSLYYSVLELRVNLHTYFII